MLKRKKIIAIIGDANSNEDISWLAFEIGKLIIDNGYRLANGGMYGVMEYSAKGARSSLNYKDGDIIGILPSYNSKECNDYIDIPITTGIGVARNGVLTSMCNAIIAIGGGAGTLSEIALAWQMKKLIVCVGEVGWHKKINNLKLDQRRNDNLFVANTPEESLRIINTKIEQYPKQYDGVSTKNISINKAQSIIKDNFNTGELEILGKGSEGIVLTDYTNVFKLFYSNERNLDKYWYLLFFF